MKTRILTPVLLAMLLVSCGGDAGEAASDAPAAAEMSPEEQALAELRADWAQHYNMHHASVVADYYAEDAFLLAADGTIDSGRDAILASLEAQMEGSPTITLPGAEVMVFGDQAVTMGPYAVETTLGDSDPVTISGSYLTAFSKESGEWKITLAVTNYDSPRPEGWAWAEGEGDPPDDDGTMTEMLDGLAMHFNMGHPSMVADYYTVDVMSAGADVPITTGREAVASSLEGLLSESPSAHLTVHDVATIELAEGWALDGGWFQLDASEGGEAIGAGAYLILCKQAEDGSWQIHWEVTNLQPAAD